MHAVRKSVSAHCTPTPRRCTTWQSMGCDRGAQAIHKRAVHWRKPNTRHRCLLQRAPAPHPASHPIGWVLGLCTCAVHHRLQATGSQAAAAGNDERSSVLAPAMGPPAPSTRPTCPQQWGTLSSFARTGNPTRLSPKTPACSDWLLLLWLQQEGTGLRSCACLVGWAST